MQYPLISEYVRAIQDASNNLDELAHLVPVQDDHGEPYRSSGAFAVVFKMKDEQTGKCYALKCFTEEQEGRAEAYLQIADELEFVDSSYITSVKYLEKEIFVDSSCEEDEFPVLLMDWIDGETMESYIAENYQDNYVMAMLCYRFCKMAEWLRSQQIAHGDIKPDNIMVRPDGYLTLIDYDGMFVPAMKGQKSPTIGTKDFSHPLRTVDDFDETIDDFALASIALSLKAISLKPSLLDEYGAADRLLFSAEDYRDLSKSKVMATLQELMNNEEMNTLLSLFLLAYAKKNLEMCSFNCFSLINNLFGEGSIISTEANEDDLSDYEIEDFVDYSKDGVKLLSASFLKGTYIVKEGVKVICNGAFKDCYDLSELVIPESVEYIGEGVFKGCNNLHRITIPFSLRKFTGNPFCGWKLGELIIKSPNYIVSDGVVFDKNNTEIVAFLSDVYEYTIPVGIKKIANSAFANCKRLQELVIPDSVVCIGDSAFANCGVYRIKIPAGFKKFDGNPFCNWFGLSIEINASKFVLRDGVIFDKENKSIVCCRTDNPFYVIPDGIQKVCKNAFANLRRLKKVVLPSSVKTIEKGAFRDCWNLVQINIPSGITKIDDEVFCGCDSLQSILLPQGLMTIGKSAFEGCSELDNVEMPVTVTHLGIAAFKGCGLNNIVIPRGVKELSNSVFEECCNLNRVECSDIDTIGEFAFSKCYSLLSIKLPNSLKRIKSCAFNECTSLCKMHIPFSVETVGDDAFCGCEQLNDLDKKDIVVRFGANAIETWLDV